MTAFELLLAAVGLGSGIISGLVILSFSKSPGLGAGVALAVWGTTAAVLAFDMTPVQTAVVMAAACAPFAAAAGIRAGRLENRKRADEARRTLAKLLPQGWNPQTGPEADPEGTPDDVQLIIDPLSHPPERVARAMENCLAGRRGDTARVIAENIAARLQAQIDLDQRGTPEAQDKIQQEIQKEPGEESREERPEGRTLPPVSPKILLFGAAAGMVHLLMNLEEVTAGGPGGDEVIAGSIAAALEISLALWAGPRICAPIWRAALGKLPESTGVQTRPAGGWPALLHRTAVHTGPFAAAAMAGTLAFLAIDLATGVHGGTGWTRVPAPAALAVSLLLCRTLLMGTQADPALTRDTLLSSHRLWRKVTGHGPLGGGHGRPGRRGKTEGKT